jgi:hypothetical protein
MSAVKLDSGKRKYSLIHPLMMKALLLDLGDNEIIDAVISLSRCAHATTQEELIENLMLSVKWITKYSKCLEPDNRSYVLDQMTIAMEYGERKVEYGRNNWKKGMEYSRLLDAAMRHGIAVALSEGIDKESGNGHIAHMLASIHMLLGIMELNTGTNDIF